MRRLPGPWNGPRDSKRRREVRVNDLAADPCTVQLRMWHDQVQAGLALRQGSVQAHVSAVPQAIPGEDDPARALRVARLEDLFLQEERREGSSIAQHRWP